MPAFKRVLIANRGEIACRIMRACSDLGLDTVAVCSEADAGAMHTQFAGKRVVIGPAPARESYLRIDRIIEAAVSTGAQAIHPGYGFLAESAEFASAVIAAGLTWIGPSPQTIADMGDKERARELARVAGVPIASGSGRITSTEPAALEAATAEVGYPLLVKAAAGGGGIGMRRVEQPAELHAVVTATQTLAARLFGDGAVYFERFIPRARHVEVQVLGDGRGKVVHLFERDCSMQRRYQKVIEESPAPGLSSTTRVGLLGAAVKLAEAQRYLGPGTVEFLVDAQTGEFFFLEMNTRIQVEHPVTEMVTGLDIVALQLKLANHEPLSLTQSDICSQGHSIECRLYAENPLLAFRPSSGTLQRLEFPPASKSVRIDTGYRQGDIVSPHYDPLVAKLIVHADSREDAINLMADTLSQTSVAGIHTNLAFLKRAIVHPDFRAAEMDTGFIERQRDALMQMDI